MAKSKKVKHSGRYPSKVGLNLVYKEKDTKANVFAISAFVVFMIALGFFTKFMVIDQLAAVNAAEAEYKRCENELKVLQKNNEDYDAVEAEYSRYGAAYFTADELSLADRQKMLDSIEKDIKISSGISAINFSGNIATVQIESIQLSEVSATVAALENDPLISYVSVGTAAKNEENRRSGLVAATLTIQFSDPSQVTVIEGGKP